MFWLENELSEGMRYDEHLTKSHLSLKTQSEMNTSFSKIKYVR
jgi:hypothetical protein